MAESDEQLSRVERVLAAELEARRPAPRAAFRGALARRLTSLDPGYGHRPAWLWARAGLAIGAGALLLVLGVLVGAGAI